MTDFLPNTQIMRMRRFCPHSKRFCRAWFLFRVSVFTFSLFTSSVGNFRTDSVCFSSSSSVSAVRLKLARASRWARAFSSVFFGYGKNHPRGKARSAHRAFLSNSRGNIRYPVFPFYRTPRPGLKKFLARIFPKPTRRIRLNTACAVGCATRPPAVRIRPVILSTGPTRPLAAPGPPGFISPACNSPGKAL